MSKPILFHFGVFLVFVFLGAYAGNINSSLLGIDMTTASESYVQLVKIAFWSMGFGWLSWSFRR